MKVLVFSPHPDDDLIGCGGTMSKLIKEQNDVKVVYLTNGEAGSLKYSKEELSKIRNDEARKALSILGLNDPIFLDNPDGYLEYNKENLVKLIEIIRSEKPELVFIPHDKDQHKDHQKTYELVTESINRAAGPWFQECQGKPWAVGNILCYEVWTPLQEINYVEDISDNLDTKISALECHKSQLADIKYGEAVKSLNRYRGIMTGKGKYCECFKVLKINTI